LTCEENGTPELTPLPHYERPHLLAPQRPVQVLPVDYPHDLGGGRGGLRYLPADAPCNVRPWWP